MAIPESGAVSFSEIQTEFTGSNPISLSEYLGITAIPDNIPASGTVSISDFRGTAYIIPEQSDQWISFTGTSTFTGGLGRPRIVTGKQYRLQVYCLEWQLCQGIH